MTDDHFYLESLEAFQRDLGEAGFRPVEAANQACWRGPIHKAFASLTAATTMDILNFQRKLPNVATFDRSELDIHRGGWGDLHGVVNRDPLRIDVGPGRASSPDHLRGLWFHAGRLPTPPPRQLSEVFRCLSRTQAKGLKRELDRRRGPSPFVPSGGVDLILFCWERHGTTDLLVMACEGMNNGWRRSHCSQDQPMKAA